MYIIAYIDGWHIIDRYGTEYGTYDTFEEALDNL
jgi:hypothetical protein